MIADTQLGFRKTFRVKLKLGKLLFKNDGDTFMFIIRITSIFLFKRKISEKVFLLA